MSPYPDRTPKQDAGRRSAVITMITLSVLLLGLTIALLRHKPPSPPGSGPVVDEMDIFDTYARFTLWTDEDTARAALASCEEELQALHKTINTYDPESELSSLNRAAAEAPFACSARLWDILAAARQAYEDTDRAFDVSVGPLMALWGFHRRRDTLPSDQEISDALAKVGLHRVEFDAAAKTVHFTVPGMALDLGGIAKGYALDQVMTALHARGIDRALVDLGGNIGCTKLAPPGREQFFIGIRNPFDTSSMLGRLGTVARSVATSGNYERRIVIQGKMIGHIVDPTTGRPVNGPAGVTAVTPKGVDSDVFSTAVFVRGAALATTLCEQRERTGFVLISGEPEAPVRTLVGDVQVED